MSPLDTGLKLNIANLITNSVNLPPNSLKKVSNLIDVNFSFELYFLALNLVHFRSNASQSFESTASLKGKYI